MSRRYSYIYTPKPGHSENEVNRDPNEENAWILKKNEGTGRVEDMLDAGPIMRRRKRPKKPYEYTPTDRIVTAEDSQKVFEVLPEEKLGRGVKWLHQIIYRHVQLLGTATIADVVRAVVQEERVLPPTEHYEDQIEGAIDNMRDRFLIRRTNNGLKVQSRMEYEKPLVEYKRGYIIPMKKIEELSMNKSNSSITLGEAKSYLCDGLRIVEDPDRIKKYLSGLEELGVLEHTYGDWYEYQEPLEPISSRF